ncbi:hypothetical protein GGF46_003809 [Coemansia sp. RSA 552]|nr:hypothetical protein GGF46_003809 [Coemansia sp. RSA 552]
MNRGGSAASGADEAMVLAGAEMAELLTPFLSPSATPQQTATAMNTVRTFSPLTSPALAPTQRPASGAMRGQHRPSLPSDRTRRTDPVFSPVFEGTSAEDDTLAALVASLNNTPAMPPASNGGASGPADLSGLFLPDSMLVSDGPPSQTLHQLSATTLHQLSATASSQGWSASSGQMATPAMLMNLPESAHHPPQSEHQPTRLSPGILNLTVAPAPHTSALHMATQSAPMGEFIHPPMPPPLRIGPAEPGVQRARRQTVTSSGDARKRGEANRARRRTRATQLLSPRTTPLVPSVLKEPSSMTSPTPTTPAASSTPRTRPIAAVSTSTIIGLEADVVTRLATKSNYQNIMEGQSEKLGLRYHSEFKTGLEKRRTNHKNAEQKRRDSLKLCFQDLRLRLPDVDPKLVSKIYLLNQANAYIDHLHELNGRMALALREQGVDPEALVADIPRRTLSPYPDQDMVNDDPE